MNYWIIPGVTTKRELEADTIINVVSRVTGIKAVDIKGRQRIQDVVDARYLCFYILRRKTNLSHKKIGAIFNKHHSTVIHGVATINDLRCIDKAIKRLLIKITDGVENL